jgi:hypothetical protein
VTSSAPPRALARLGALALSALGGAVIGLVGSFAHQSLPPVGIALAIGTVTLFLTGLRVKFLTRGPAAFGAAGIAAVTLVLSSPGAGGSVVIAANPLGYAWSLGIVLVAFVVLAWPRVQRRAQPPAGSIEMTALEKKDQPAP